MLEIHAVPAADEDGQDETEDDDQGDQSGEEQQPSEMAAETSEGGEEMKIDQRMTSKVTITISGGVDEIAPT